MGAPGSVDVKRFPERFLWGSATAAHQVEGDCRNNQWWAWEQEGLRVAPPRGYVRDGTVSAIACVYYHRFEEDHRLARELGQNALRISIEWSRIEPEPGRFDASAIDHYKRVVDSMRENGLEPTVTLHHFTNPIWAERAGGWENPEMPGWLARFAAYAVRALADRVRLWWTINEPMIPAALGYVKGVHPPCVRDLARAKVVAEHMLRAHGMTYRAIHEAARHDVAAGPVFAMSYFEPLDPDSEADRREAAISDFFMNEYFVRGLREGIVAAPIGDDAVVPGLRDSFDHVGINYYMRVLCRGGAEPDVVLGGERRASEPDRLVDEMGWEYFPEGLHRNLVRLQALGKPIYVTENGIATLDDDARTTHLLAHLAEVAHAIDDGADVRGYFYWSLMDNFEWAEGYSRHFGLLEVDRKTLARRPRPAAFVYRDVIAANALP
jgi:beta-glucosidase